MVRDGDVLVSKRKGGFDHRCGIVAAVAPQRVHLEIAADIVLRQKRGAPRPPLLKPHRRRSGSREESTAA